MPPNPALGDSVRMLDAQGQAAAHNLTVARNGHLIGGSASDLTIATANSDAELASPAEGQCARAYRRTDSACAGVRQ